LLGSRLPFNTSEATLREPNTGSIIGLPKATPLHQVSDHGVGRQLGQFDPIVIILDEPFEQLEQSAFFRAGPARFGAAVELLHSLNVAAEFLLGLIAKTTQPRVTFGNGAAASHLRHAESAEKTG
jgi:hypothetical protein